jgi:hypothetical protein
MAYPQWLTPAGNLGIVPSAEYYQFLLDAYDTAGGTLQFTKLSGILPPGLQITRTGVIQGIPVSTAGPDINQEYNFTVRVKNLSDNLIADRSFNLTITNVAPPIIVPRNVDLGEYFDGQTVELQLEATEFILGDNLSWSLKSGTIPPGLTVSPGGLIHGYIELIPAAGPSSNPGWDLTDWDERYTISGSSKTLGWEFPTGTAAKHFEFTIEVSDGARTDVSTYKMYVVPKLGTTADSTYLTVDTTTINGIEFTVDTGSRHNPIIITTQSSVDPGRQGDWYTFKIDAIDLDGDVLNYVVPTLSKGSFDEQANVLGQSTYIGRSFVTGGNISVGTIFGSNTTPYLQSGDAIQVLIPFTDITSSQTTHLWYNATVNNHASMTITGNTMIVANVGEWITQTIDSANATVTSVGSTTGNINIGGGPILGTISIGGNLIVSANIGDVITQNGSAGNAVVTVNASVSAILNVRFYNVNFVNNGGNLKINGANVASYPTTRSFSSTTTVVTANVGDFITQASTGANATVIKAHSSYNTDTLNPTVFEVIYNSGPFTVNSGNIAVNGANLEAYPTSAVYSANIGFIYNDANTFRLGSDASALVYHNGLNTFARPSRFLKVGVDVTTISTQGTIGFDEGKFDQGDLALPGSLQLNAQSGWVTGFLPTQTANETIYDFEIQVYKRDYTSYISSKLLTITVYGDLYNTVDWLTPSYLGTINNGDVSDLILSAISSKGKQVYYYYTPGTYINMVQGLRLQPDGLISGRVSFELFGLDAGTTTFDGDIITGDPDTTFDHTFEFSVTAQTYDQSTSATRRFSILVRSRNIRPYENLYLQAQLNSLQRLEFRDVMQNTTVFPQDLIYRSTDPWYGIADSVRTLFLPGLSPSTLADYAQALATNHFTKRLLFTDVKSAVARADGIYDVIDNASGLTVGTYNVYTRLFVPLNFELGYTVIANSIPSGTTIGDQSVKYEVVYAEIKDENTNDLGQGPADTINLAGEIRNAYLDNGNSYVIATPNAFTNMDNVIIQNIGYQNKGALPDWMSSIQPNGIQLGFTRAVVLAYIKPGYGQTVAWRFNELGYNLNEINFTVDQYYLDNVYSADYNTTANTFTTSRETTFDRYPPLSGVFKPVDTVDYAVNIPFQNINERTIGEISAVGGLDGITSFKAGEKLVFFEQEFSTGVINISDPNQGWTDSSAPWDDLDVNDADWDYNGTQGWDPANYVPGYDAWLSSRIVDSGGNVSYSAFNQRIGIWSIHIDSSDYVRLELANVIATVSSYASNTTGYGSNVTVTSTEGLFVGMPVRGAGISNITVITDIIGGNITIYPSITTLGANIVCVPSLNYNDSVYVRNGFTHGGVNIYYDPYIKEDKLVPSFSEIPQEIKTTGTIFDGDGTKFYDYRVNYVIPGQGEQAVRFPRLNVFD